jgi:outer membrane immunogenic protein
MRFHRFARSVVAALVFSFGAGPVAFAADMPLKAPRAPVAQYGWSGFYIGANGGYGTSSSNWVDDPALGSSDLGGHRTTGGFAGSQIGYNWQYGIAVAGFDADLDWASLKGNHIDPFLHSLNTKVTSLGTITGRLGAAYWDRTLLYVKGGMGFAQFKYDDFVTASGPLNGSSSSSRWGWALGAGIEYGFAPNWSAKLEYNYLGFNPHTVAFSGGVAGGYVQTIRNDIQLVKAGINVRFGP